ncbi:GNAT family N-acetyltransferase [Anaerobacillus alkaliphilus]|uniref:GNAT family N-acetyltransferase n=1 Tax=Anaerobacillus alkaliphilus TaxID=1548597 RepID=A0A4Q0VRR0_9BACI|nr:GNAT family N-acetyltransferase [Anaerobacillus alkaliphilus]RXI98607.1 GNAT family N-acetyltransferase [Anaerobacillus alkaliphilus]
MGISLVVIDRSNWEDAIQLSVAEEQKSYIASNLYSIAEVQFLETFQVMAVYLADTMVGFTMFGIDPDDNNFWIYRLMIDQKYQGKGIGRQAIQLIIEEIHKQNIDNIPFIMIGYHPNNLLAKKAYQKAGFIETELAPWGEQLAMYQL